MISREVLDFAHEGRADSLAGSVRRDVAGTQFVSLYDKGSNPDNLAVGFRHEAYLVVGIFEKARYGLFRDGQRRPIFNNGLRVILSGDPAHCGVVHFQKRARIVVAHPSNVDCHRQYSSSQ
jgi:hypothetical protein